MLELKQIRELTALLRQEGIKRLRLKQDNYEVEIEVDSQVPGEKPQLTTEKGKISQEEAKVVASPKGVREKESGLYILSPMVGTFHRSPAPNAQPFIQVGDTLDIDTVVCIVEAMKVMNEVKAGVKGLVREILVETGQPVEFGTKLFSIT